MGEADSNAFNYAADESNRIVYLTSFSIPTPIRNKRRACLEKKLKAN